MCIYNGCTGMCVHCWCSGPQEGTGFPETRITASCKLPNVRMLGTKSTSYARAASVLNTIVLKISI